MAAKSRGRRNNTNPESTRREILQAALEVLAKDGAESLSVTEVARRAGVNRGTAYQHFPTREDLAHATADWVSERIYEEFYGDMAESEVSKDYPPQLAQERLCSFAMNNPELSRAWWFDLMSNEGRMTDRFWQRYMKELREFIGHGLAHDDIDVEIYAFITIASTMLWPIWAGAHSKSPRARADLEKRFVDELMRLFLFGALNREKFPDLVAQYGKKDK